MQIRLKLDKIRIGQKLEEIRTADFIDGYPIGYIGYPFGYQTGYPF